MAAFFGCTSTGRLGLCFRWFYVQELPKAQPAVILVLKRLRRRGNGLKSHPTDWEKPGIEPATPGLQDIGLSYDRHFVCGRVPLLYQYWPSGFIIFVVLCPGTPEGSTGSGSGFKASQKTGKQLKVSSDRLGEAGNRTCDSWFIRHRFIPYTTHPTDTENYSLYTIPRRLH